MPKSRRNPTSQLHAARRRAEASASGGGAPSRRPRGRRAAGGAGEDDAGPSPPKKRSRNFDHAPASLSEEALAALPEADRRRVELVNRLVSTASTRHARVFPEGEPAPGTVREALREMLPGVTDIGWAERRRVGDVFVNGRPARTLKDRLPVPCRVEFFELKVPPRELAAAYPALDASHVVHRDEHMAVVFKPAGLPSNPPKEQKLYSLRGLVPRVLGAASCHLPSRLDLSTAGLVALSVAKPMHNKVQKLFQARRIEKFYLLEASGAAAGEHAPGGATVRCDRGIGPHPLHSVLRLATEDGSGQEAQTDFTPVAEGRVTPLGAGGPSGAAVETRVLLAQPLTGRTHQIRVHAGALGLPLVNDHIYGGVAAAGADGNWITTRHPDVPGCGALRLLAFALRFEHPATGERLTVTVPDRLLPDWAAPHRDAIHRVLGERLAALDEAAGEK